MVRLKLFYKIHSEMYEKRSQFHYGSIKTANEIINEVSEIYSLNSTMVRLKQNSFTGMSSDGIGSQFHYGSIKTKLF